MKRVPNKKAPTRRKVPRMTKAELWATFGLNKPHTPRYEGLKGIYWYVLSQYVRQRDFKLWHRCISCGKYVETWEELDAGHFIAASSCGFALLFDPFNVNGECKGCNAFDSNHLVGYERNLDIRLGPGTAQRLKDTYLAQKKGTPAKQWTQREYQQNIVNLQVQLALL